MPHRKYELEKIINDLTALVDDYCDLDHVSEACNDACLMLQSALDELDKKD